jgi:hypothetical protein
MGQKSIEQNLLQIIETIEVLDIFEFFCKKNNIQLFWTVWDYGFREIDMYNFLNKRYSNYKHDSQAYSFEILNCLVEVNLELDVQIHLQPDQINDQTILYCHENEKEIYKDLFYTALDRYDLPKKYQEIRDQKQLSFKELNNLKKYLSVNKFSESIHGAHHGWHRNHHWALFFYDLIKDLVD